MPSWKARRAVSFLKRTTGANHHVSDWQNLSPGPELRRIIADRLGWHMRKTWVGTGEIEYDFLVYNNDDHLVYQREVNPTDMANEDAITEQTWLDAMNDEDCPRWDENLEDALDLTYGMSSDIKENGSAYHAWVKSPEFTAQAPTKPLALVYAWLEATDQKFSGRPS